MYTLKERYQSLQDRIMRACHKSGRHPTDIQLIWVSKTQPAAALVEAYSLGARDFGESRVQEVLAKQDELAHLLYPAPFFPVARGAFVAESNPKFFNGTILTDPDLLNNQNNMLSSSLYPSHPVRLHFIGRLQSNKVRKILPYCFAIHSIDSLGLLMRVSQISQELGISSKVFLECNMWQEASKAGLTPQDWAIELQKIWPLSGLTLQGLMTMAPYGADPTSLRKGFAQLAKFSDQLKTQLSLPDLKLSMGMSADFEFAIEEGSHYIRVGTELFGDRGGNV